MTRSTSMVVYEAIRIPEGLSRRSRERRIEQTKDGYRAILRTLARGKRTGLKPEEARVLALWPEGVSNATLRTAALHLRFQLGQADRFRGGLKRSGRWRKHIVTMLRKHRVPLELAALPHVESSFNPAAYSSVGAAGLWQFTRSTGRLFMRVDSVVDERMDPFIASEGAARLLRSNYDVLGSWPLAITAYNHGVGGMKRAVRKLGTSDIDVIIKKYKSRSFGFASRNFYAEFLAALDVDQNTERFFGPIDFDSPVRYDTVTLDHFYTARVVESTLGVDPSVLREHNQSLRPFGVERSQVPSPRLSIARSECGDFGRSRECDRLDRCFAAICEAASRPFPQSPTGRDTVEDRSAVSRQRAGPRLTE